MMSSCFPFHNEREDKCIIKRKRGMWGKNNYGGVFTSYYRLLTICGVCLLVIAGIARYCGDCIFARYCGN